MILSTFFVFALCLGAENMWESKGNFFFSFICLVSKKTRCDVSLILVCVLCFFFPVLLCILCWKQSLCWLLFLLVFVLILSSNNVSIWWKKILLFYFFFLLLFPTYQTPKLNRTEPKPNAIGWFGVPSLQIGFNAQYVKTEILDSMQKLSSTPTKLNRLHP